MPAAIHVCPRALTGSKAAQRGCNQGVPRPGFWPGVDAMSLPEMWCERRGRGHGTLAQYGLPLAGDLVRKSQCAICPACVSMAGRIRAEWEMRYVVACPDHECWLVDTCLGCNRPISWRRKAVGLCRCGFDFSKCPTSKAPASIQFLSAMFANRLRGFMPALEVRGRGFPKKLDRIGLNGLIGLAKALSQGVSMRGGDAAAEGALMSTALRQQAGTACLIADALDSWPSGLHRSLEDGIRARVGEPGEHVDIVTNQEARGVSLFSNRWKLWRKSGMPAFLREEVRRFASDRSIVVGNKSYVSLRDRDVKKDDSGRELACFKGWGQSFKLSGDFVLSPAATLYALGATSGSLQAFKLAGLLARAGGPMRAYEVDHALHSVNAKVSYCRVARTSLRSRRSAKRSSST